MRAITIIKKLRYRYAQKYKHSINENLLHYSNWLQDEIAELTMKQENGVEKSASTCNLQNVVRSLRFDKPTTTGWLFDSELLRKTTKAARKHDPLISMEQVEYVLRGLADKQ